MFWQQFFVTLWQDGRESIHSHYDELDAAQFIALLLSELVLGVFLCFSLQLTGDLSRTYIASCP